MIRGAPPGQISEAVRTRCKACDPTKAEDILELFQWIHAQPETEVSRFVKELVNPRFTVEDSYNKEDNTD